MRSSLVWRPRVRRARPSASLPGPSSAWRPDRCAPHDRSCWSTPRVDTPITLPSTIRRSLSRVDCSWAAVCSTASNVGPFFRIGPRLEHQREKGTPEILLRRTPRCRYSLQPVSRRGGGRVEQPLLGSEIVVHQRRVDVGGSRDRAHRRSGPTGFGERLARGTQYAGRQHTTLIARTRRRLRLGRGSSIHVQLCRPRHNIPLGGSSRYLFIKPILANGRRRR